MSSDAERVLLQRADELDRVEAAMADARAGLGGALLVEGPAGIGKTTLLEEACRRATATGMLALRGRASELERAYPLGVIRQCLLPVLAGTDAGVRARLLDGAAAVATPILLDAPGIEAVTPFEVLRGLYWLLANLGTEAPVVLCMDDMQWSDEASLRLLAFLVRRVESLPVLLLVAARVEPERGPSQALIWTIRSDPATKVLEPRPLDEGAVQELLADGGADVDAEFARACHEATGGNPFLLWHLKTALRTEEVPYTANMASRVSRVTPPEVARRVQRELADLGPAAGALARALAILGDGASVGEVALLAGLPAPAAHDIADVLARNGLLRHDLPLRFRHPLLSGAVAAGMTFAEHQDGHRDASELLRQRGATPERQALHLVVVEPAGSDEAVVTLRAAARRASDRGAPQASALLLRRALAEPPSGEEVFEVALELAEAEHSDGRSDDAINCCARAYDLASDGRARSRVLDLWGTVVGPDMQALAALAPLVERELREPSNDDRELMLRLRALQLVGLLPHPDPDRALLDALIAEAAALAGDTPGEATVLGVLIFHLVRWNGTASDVRQAGQRAARQADALMAQGVDSKAFSATVHGLRWTDELAHAERLLLDAIALARRRGSEISFAFASAMLAEVHRRLGMLREAEADARAAAAAGQGWVLAMAAGTLAACLLDQGDTHEAWQTLDAYDLTGPLGSSPPETDILLVRMRVRAAADDRAGALRDWRDAVARPVRGSPAANWIEHQVAVTDVLRMELDAPAARALANEARETAMRWGTPGAIGEALYAVARSDRGDDAIETFRESVAQLESAPTRVVHARALIDLGGALRRRGDRRDSREPLRAGLAMAETSGAAKLAMAARTELAAGGARVAPRRPRGADLLTASEQRISVMAAAGASNAEIAQAQFLTVKTIEMHLTNSYRKLHVSSRHELADALRLLRIR